MSSFKFYIINIVGNIIIIIVIIFIIIFYLVLNNVIITFRCTLYDLIILLLNITLCANAELEFTKNGVPNENHFLVYYIVII